MTPACALAVALMLAAVPAASRQAVALDADHSPAESQDRTACLRDLAAREARVTANPDDLYAGAEYRQVAIGCRQVDRAIGFFERLVKANPRVPNARVNAAFAYIDKIPTSSDLRQALLGRSAIGQLSKVIEAEATWLALQTRGTVRLYYPNRFGQFRAAVADLERALSLVRAGPSRPYHARTYVSLGDAYYWRLHDAARARAMWSEGADRFPGHEGLRARLDSEPKVMREIVREAMNADVRIDTSLRELQQ